MAINFGKGSDYRRQKGTREITLTFDDGPHPKYTPRLLDILAEEEIGAIFFVVGQSVENAGGRSILERINAAGHIIGNHTHSHPNLKTLKPAKVREEIVRVHDLICGVTGSCNLFRPPYGATNGIVREVLNDFGYQQVLWTVDTLDWKLKKDGAWVQNAMQQIRLREDSIVLMHDIHSTTVDNVQRLVKEISGFRDCCYVCAA